MSGIEQLAHQLIIRIYTSQQLGQVAAVLETMAANPDFKSHARQIATDPHMPSNLKTQQLTALFKNINLPIVTKFFTEMFSQQQFWIFSSDQFDYFDEFVQKFQMQVHQVVIVYMAVAN